MAAQPRSAAPRGHEIIETLRRSGGSSRIAALAASLGVSEETVRRNLRQLSEDGLVHKVHGAVHLVEPKTEPSFSDRMQVNPEAKQRIAAQVAALVPEGASLFLDVGATTAYIARALQGHANLFIVTNSVAVAHSLAARNGNRVFMPGGELRAHDGGVFGLETLDFVARFQTDFAILSTAAIDPAHGFSLFDLDEARFSHAIMDRATTRLMAADSSKFGRRAPIALARPERIDLLVTDALPPAELAERLSRWEIEVLVAHPAPSLPRAEPRRDP